MLDSGVGGLSVLREVQRALPEHDILYLGDQKWCPYGNKSYEEIIRRCFLLTDYLIEQGAEAIIIACNSATIAAIGALRAHYPIPFIGMEPGVKPATALTKSNVIGVLATEASLKGDKFHRLLHSHARDIRVITQPCPRFVELVEAGILEGPDVNDAIREYTSEALSLGADVFVLGCSHYPFLLPALRQLLPSTLSFIDTGEAIARQTAKCSLTSSPAPSVKIQSTLRDSSLRDLISSLIPGLNTQSSYLDL